MQMVGAFFLIVGVTCVSAGLLLQFLGDTATVALWDKLRYVGLSSAALGLVVTGLSLVVG